jgi:DNA-binding response OmpR family regulator
VKRNLAGARVLIAEDNIMVAMDLASEFEASGAEVMGPFARVEEAIAALLSGKPDGAILDVNLLDGIVTPLAVNLIETNVPVVFCTGVSLPTELGAHYPDAQVFIKPTSSDRLVDALALRLVPR